MLGRTSLLIAGVIFLSASARAATLALSYTSVQFAADAAFTTNVVTVPVGPDNLVIPAGQYFRFGIQATVTGNPNSAGALASGVARGVPQPAQLGVSSFGMSVVNLSPGLVAPVVSADYIQPASTAQANEFFISVRQPGDIDTGSGSIGIGTPNTLIAGAFDPAGAPYAAAALQPAITIGTSASASGNTLFAGLAYQLKTSQPVRLSPSIPAGSLAFVAPASDGLATNQLPTYKLRLSGTSTDTIIGPGTLQIGVPEPASLALVGIGGAILLRRRRRA